MTIARVRRRWLWLPVLVLAALVALAWWFPARWAWDLMRGDYPLVHAGDVGGSVWDGHMDGFVVAGQRLGTLHWTLGRAAVFGHVHGTLEVHGSGVMANGHIARTDTGAIVIRNAHFRIPMRRLKILWPGGMPLQGQLRGSVARARLVQGWPVRLKARVRWRDAAVVTHGQRVALGDWSSRWHASGGSVVTAHLHDDGSGPVRLRGKFTLTTLGWRLDAALTPRRHVAGLRQWLRRIGQPAPGGGVRVQRSGGLMAGRTW